MFTLKKRCFHHRAGRNIGPVAIGLGFCPRCWAPAVAVRAFGQSPGCREKPAQFESSPRGGNPTAPIGCRRDEVGFFSDDAVGFGRQSSFWASPRLHMNNATASIHQAATPEIFPPPNGKREMFLRQFFRRRSAIAWSSPKDDPRHFKDTLVANTAFPFAGLYPYAPKSHYLCRANPKPLWFVRWSGELWRSPLRYRGASSQLPLSRTHHDHFRPGELRTHGFSERPIMRSGLAGIDW